MFSEKQLKNIKPQNKNEKVISLTKTSEEDKRIINEWIKNNKDRLISVDDILGVHGFENIKELRKNTNK